MQSVLPSLSSLSPQQQVVLHPYVNVPSSEQRAFPVAYYVLEFAFLSLAGLLMGHARATGRAHVIAACMAFGLGMETLGFVVRSHAHGQFVFQVTSYLPLKEDLWYALTLYPPVVLAQDVYQAGLEGSNVGNKRSIVGKALLVAVLGILQDAPYEFVNARPGVDVVYVNHEDFKLGDLGELINGGSATVILSYTLCALSFGLVLPNLETNSSVLSGVLAGFMTCAVACVAQTPFHFLKYLGCRQLFPVLFSKGWFAFHSECLCNSSVSTGACLILMTVVFTSLLLKSLLMDKKNKSNNKNANRSPKTNGVALYVSAFGCHITFVTLLLLAHEFDAFCFAVLLANMTVHLCLMAWLETRCSLGDSKRD